MDAALPTNLAAPVTETLRSFVESARGAFGEDLQSIVLFGSAAEGRLRPASDVNVLVLLAAFEREKADRLREPLRMAHAAVRLAAMFLLEAELPSAIESFAVKFGDIARRHRVLFGRDPFSTVTVPRAAAVARLRQTLLNLTLRMREAYIARGLREEQLVAAIAEMAGPLRACAATLDELQSRAVASPKEALEQFAGVAGASLMSRITEARTHGALPPGTAGTTLAELTDLSRSLWAAAQRL
ncbi:MAG: nucleotidyltransferase domain-containing protein [Chthoniobacter sp.]|nr:nucleotidyltransferase domain-containing protein [Chthoniobacter sp.]